MDPRLFNVSWTGSIQNLHRLLEADPFALYNVVLASGNTPLHIACMRGHLDFVQEILKLRPEFAGELNQDGFSPLHIASANGYIEIVKELLNFNKNLSLLVGRECRIPLHNAVVKGKVNVITQLLEASVDSIEMITAQGETALHLTVRNNQFAAFKLLLEHAKIFNKEGVLSNKDNQGNTILHLAVSKKQYEVVEFLLNGQMFSQDKIEVNSLNDRNLTPLDVLQLFQSDAGDREIEGILKRAGALKASNLTTNFPSSVNNQSHNMSISLASYEQPLAANQVEPGRSRFDRLTSLLSVDETKKSAPDMRNTLLVIAILTATATYQTILSPPGGVFQDGDFVGKSILGHKNPLSYFFFIISNSLGFYISFNLIFFLTSSFPFRNEMYISILGMYFTYGTSLGYLSPPATSSLITAIGLVIVVLMPFVIPFAVIYLRRR